MKNTVRYIIMALVVMLAGCASIMSGTTQPITFDSQPQGATVKLNGAIIGTTPFTAEIKREKNAVVTFEKAGYRTATMPMNADMNNWWLGNLIIGGAFGTTTDYATGAMFKYETGHVTAQLSKN